MTNKKIFILFSSLFLIINGIRTENPKLNNQHSVKMNDDKPFYADSEFYSSETQVPEAHNATDKIPLTIQEEKSNQLDKTNHNKLHKTAREEQMKESDEDSEVNGEAESQSDKTDETEKIESQNNPKKESKKAKKSTLTKKHTTTNNSDGNNAESELLTDDKKDKPTEVKDIEEDEEGVVNGDEESVLEREADGVEEGEKDDNLDEEDSEVKDEESKPLKESKKKTTTKSDQTEAELEPLSTPKKEDTNVTKDIEEDEKETDQLEKEEDKDSKKDSKKDSDIPAEPTENKTKTKVEKIPKIKSVTKVKKAESEEDNFVIFPSSDSKLDMSYFENGEDEEDESTPKNMNFYTVKPRINQEEKEQNASKLEKPAAPEEEEEESTIKLRFEEEEVGKAAQEDDQLIDEVFNNSTLKTPQDTAEVENEADDPYAAIRDDTLDEIDEEQDEDEDEQDEDEDEDEQDEVKGRDGSEAASETLKARSNQTEEGVSAQKSILGFFDLSKQSVSPGKGENATETSAQDGLVADELKNATVSSGKNSTPIYINMIVTYTGRMRSHAASWAFVLILFVVAICCYAKKRRDRNYRTVRMAAGILQTDMSHPNKSMAGSYFGSSKPPPYSEQPSEEEDGKKGYIVLY